MIVYHVTPKCHLPGIRREGVRPDLARGRLKASWWVSGERLAWAIAHICHRHGVVPGRVVILPADIDRDKLVGTRYPGVFFTREVVDLKDKIAPLSATDYLNADEGLILSDVNPQ